MAEVLLVHWGASVLVNEALVPGMTQEGCQGEGHI